MNKEKDVSSVYGQGSPANYTICCCGFTNEITKDVIRQSFSQYGTIVDIQVSNDDGYVFIEFTTEEAATRAIEATNNTEINGRIVKVFWKNENHDTNIVRQNANKKIEQSDESCWEFVTNGIPSKSSENDCKKTDFLGNVFKAASVAAGFGPGGSTAAGGLVATCQSIGATGTILGSTAATATAGAFGGLFGAAASTFFYRSEEEDKQ